MKWGIDEYSRYFEFNGERYAVETYPYWGLAPRSIYYQVSSLVGIGIWRVSKFTGLGWAGHEAERDVNE